MPPQRPIPPGDAVPCRVTSEVVLGKRYYTAVYAEDPAISFRAATEKEAVRQLNVYLGGLHALWEPVDPRFPMPSPPRPGLRPSRPL